MRMPGVAQYTTSLSEVCDQLDHSKRATADHASMCMCMCIVTLHRLVRIWQKYCYGEYIAAMALEMIDFRIAYGWVAIWTPGELSWGRVPNRLHI